MKTFTKHFLVAISLMGAVSLYATEPKLKSTEISFKENKGQVCDQDHKPRPDVLFSGSSNGMVYHLKANGVSYQLNRVDKWKEEMDKRSKAVVKIPELTSVYRIDINWVGSNSNFKIEPGKTFDGYENFYLAHCSNGALNVRSYKEVTYKNIYANIDLKWYQKNGELEYDFIVYPGADPQQIQLEIKGAEKLSINKKGELEIKTPFGIINEKCPVAWQNNKQVSAKWLLKNNKLSFFVQGYNASIPLIIDPVVRYWGSYYGTSADERANSSSIDGSGNVLITGYTTLTTGTLLATSGSHQASANGGSFKAYLAKFGSNGQRIWATYYGGTGAELGEAVACEANGTIYMAGSTGLSTSGIATPGAHQLTNGGMYDGFLAKFNSAGVRQWGTYYGGAANDYPFSCAVDLAGNVFIAGETASAPGTVIASGGHQNTYGGNTDVFLVKFNTSGVRQWGTYYGELGNDNQGSCATDAAGNVYLSGTTASTLNISTPGAHQVNYGGSGDSFLVKFNSAGARQWGTYYGGASGESMGCCATNTSVTDVYLSGRTASSGGTAIATVGSHQPAYGGGITDAYLAKFNTSGVRQWGTYYGGVSTDQGYACFNNPSSRVYMGGYTSTSSGTLVASALSNQPGFGGGFSDAFIVEFNASGVRQWGSYYGGTGDDQINSICSNSNNLYIAGSTSTPTGNAVSSTTGYQPNYGGGIFDGFVANFIDCSALTLSVASAATLCAGASASLSAIGLGFATYSWSNGGNTQSITVTPTVTTTYTVVVLPSIASCSMSATQTISVNALPILSLTANLYTTCISSAGGQTVGLTGLPSGGNYSGIGVSATIFTLQTAPGIYTVSYSYTASTTGCSNTINQFIDVDPAPSLTLSASLYTTCTVAANGQTISLTGIPSGGSYSGIGVTGNIFNIQTATGIYTVSYSYTVPSTGCTNSIDQFINVSLCTDVSAHQLFDQKISIYPNPTIGRISVVVARANDLIIYNVLGKIVSQLKLEKGHNTLDLSGLANGVYYLNIQSEDFNSTVKVIKQE